MWRGKDVVYNILGYLVLAVPIEMPFIAYREPPGGLSSPPGHPLTPPPLCCALTRRTSYMQKLMGWVLWLTGVGGVVVVVEMQLWVTSKTIQVDRAIHYRQSLIKR